MSRRKGNKKCTIEETVNEQSIEHCPPSLRYKMARLMLALSRLRWQV